MVREQRAGLSGLLLLYLHAVIHLSLYSFNDLILSQHFLGIMRELFIDGLWIPFVVKGKDLSLIRMRPMRRSLHTAMVFSTKLNPLEVTAWSTS